MIVDQKISNGMLAQLDRASQLPTRTKKGRHQARINIYRRYVVPAIKREQTVDIVEIGTHRVSDVWSIRMAVRKANGDFPKYLLALDRKGRAYKNFSLDLLTVTDFSTFNCWLNRCWTQIDPITRRGDATRQLLQKTKEERYV